MKHMKELSWRMLQTIQDGKRLRKFFGKGKSVMFYCNEGKIIICGPLRKQKQTYNLRKKSALMKCNLPCFTATKEKIIICGPLRKQKQTYNFVFLPMGKIWRASKQATASCHHLSPSAVQHSRRSCL